jgi:hypothetical protein
MVGERTSTATRIFFGGMSGAWWRKLERDGLVPPAPRTANGYRIFTPEYIEQVRPIVDALKKKHGGAALTA